MEQSKLEGQPLLPGPNTPTRARASADVDKTKNVLGVAGLSWTVVVILYYSLCSSTMLVINKVAIHNIPAPAAVLCIQMIVSALVAGLGGAFGVMEVDALEWAKLKKFAPIIGGFVMALFSNMKVLQNSNVETFITFRSSTPLLLSLFDWWYLGRTLPSVRSWICLFTLLLGAVGYVFVDTAYQVSAYYWLAVWYAAFTFDAVYVKHVCDNVRMTSWGRVYYTNLLSVAPLIVLVFALQEHTTLANLVLTSDGVISMMLACTVGVCMSHASYLLREATSATLFTVVGILCKILTVVINYFIWDKHASPEGIACLMLCLSAGTMYQQAPKRQDHKPLAS